jgi:hypothetical protein
LCMSAIATFYQGTGHRVRDAACYLCWSLCRTYAAAWLQRPVFAERLLPVMVAVAVFDREIQCRRAAAAAFQEWVGRVVRRGGSA